MRKRIRSRKTFYPWGEWLARSGWFDLVRGRDFPVSVPAYSMAQQIRNYVSSWELGSVEIDIESDDLLKVRVNLRGAELCPR